MSRKVPDSIKKILTEAGYRCALPTCRQILAIDIHHIVEISEDGSDDPSNLIALCPTCHALYHRGTIKKESLYTWKGILVALNQAFDKETIDNLLLLDTTAAKRLFVSGIGVLKFSNVIASRLSSFSLYIENGTLIL